MLVRSSLIDCTAKVVILYEFANDFVRFVIRGAKVELRGSKCEVRRAKCTKLLLHNSLFKILGQVGAYLGGHAVGCHLGHVVLDHNLHEVFERGGLRVPAELGLGLGGVAPEIDHISRAVEIGAYSNENLAF